MRKYPTSISEFIEKYNLKSDLTKSDFIDLVKTNIILRHDFALLSLISDLKHFSNGTINLNSQTLDLFPKSKRIEKWNAFQVSTDLYITELEPQNSKMWTYIMFFLLASGVGTYLVFQNFDLSFFSFLHPEILGIGLITIAFLIGGIDFLVTKLKPNDKIPFVLESETILEFMVKIVAENRGEIKREFKEIYEEKLEEFINEVKITNFV